MNYPELENLILSKKNLFISGGGGVGKSFLIDKFYNAYKDSINIVLTATTGIAALNIGGETIHRFAGLRIFDNKDKLKSITRSYVFRNETKYIIKDTDLLILDEISMLSIGQFELLNEVLKYARGNDEPFGGIQIILSGDFMQLPPVVTGPIPEKLYCFESEVWNELELENVYLTKIKRQSSEKFCKMLRFVRAGIVTPEVNEFFIECQNQKLKEDEKPVYVVSTNQEIDAINNRELDLIESEIITFKATITSKNDKLKDRIIKECRAPVELGLKVGCQVMTLVNDPSGQFVNGSIGKFIETVFLKVPMKTFGMEHQIRFVEMEHLVIELINGSVAKVPRHEFTIEKTSIDHFGERYQEKLASLNQFPVNVAYAISSHKSQGASIENMVVDMKRIFTWHQAYVMLSRARSKEGLKILNWDPQKIFVDQRCFNFYRDIFKEVNE